MNTLYLLSLMFLCNPVLAKNSMDFINNLNNELEKINQLKSAANQNYVSDNEIIAKENEKFLNIIESKVDRSEYSKIQNEIHFYQKADASEINKLYLEKVKTTKNNKLNTENQIAFDKIIKSTSQYLEKGFKEQEKLIVLKNKKSVPTKKLGSSENINIDLKTFVPKKQVTSPPLLKSNQQLVAIDQMSKSAQNEIESSLKNLEFMTHSQPYSELKFSGKGSSIDLCTKSTTGKMNCIKNNGNLDGRAFHSSKLDEKSASVKVHRISFEFTSQNYFKVNPNGYFMLGMRGSWELDADKVKTNSEIGDANGRGIIWGNIANIKVNEGNPKCKNASMELKSYSKDAFALGIAARKEMAFTESCSDQKLKDGQTYKVEVDVLKSRHISYRLYDKSGALIYKYTIQDQENSRISPQLTGWFIGHLFDIRSDNLDNDNDGIVDNETANWTMTIKNLEVFSSIK